jgi:hypothetical protein
MSSPNSFDGAAQREERYLPTALFFALQGVGPYVFIDREELRIRQTKSENGEAFARYASDPGRYVPVRAFSPRVVSQLTLEALQGLLPDRGAVTGLPSDDPRWGAQLLGRLAPDATSARQTRVHRRARSPRGVLAGRDEPPKRSIHSRRDGPSRQARRTPARRTPHTHTAPAPRDTVTPAALRVRDPRLFNAALQDRQDKGLFLHLTTLKLVEAPIGPEGAGPPVSDEEWSWLRVPPIPTQRQIEHAIHHLSPERRGELGPRLIAAGHQWSAVVARALTDAELKAV